MAIVFCNQLRYINLINCYQLLNIHLTDEYNVI